MTQTLLPFWTSDDFTTYSELDAQRTKAYQKRGPRLIEKISLALQDYEELEDQAHLREVNDLILELGSLSPSDWFDFSVEVFGVCMAPQRNSAALLRKSFLDTLKRIERRVHYQSHSQT